MRSDLFSADGHECSADWIHQHSVIRIVYGQERIDRHPTVPHILLTVHGTVPTMWALIGKAGIGLAG